MAQPQTVLGFFENTAEAQQAVHRLLAGGFTQANVVLSTQSHLNTTTGDKPAAPADADSSSGRFLSSLFGSSDEVSAGLDVARRSGTLVTVQTRSAAETKSVAELLTTAGADSVTVDEGTDQQAHGH